MKCIKEIEGLGFETSLEGQYIICRISDGFAVKIIPSGIAKLNDVSDTENIVYAPSEASADEPNKFAYAEYTALKQLRAMLNDDAVWAIFAEMIFTINSIPISTKIRTLANCVKPLAPQEENLQPTKKAKSKTTSKTKKTNKQKKSEDENEIFRASCLDQIKGGLGVDSWESKNNSVYASNDGTIGVLCLVSKSYQHSKAGPDFWYGYHPEQREILSAYAKQYIVFGFKDENELVLMPAEFVNSQAENLHTTTKNNKMYWHIRIYSIKGKYYFGVPNKGKISVEEFALHGAQAAQKAQPSASIGSTEEVSLIKITNSNFKTIKKKH